MPECWICDRDIYEGKDVFSIHIGQPLVKVSDLLDLITDSQLIVQNYVGICLCCNESLLKFYSASQVLAEIKESILQVLKHKLYVPENTSKKFNENDYIELEWEDIEYINENDSVNSNENYFECKEKLKYSDQESHYILKQDEANKSISVVSEEFQPILENVEMEIVLENEEDIDDYDFDYDGSDTKDYEVEKETSNDEDSSQEVEILHKPKTKTRQKKKCKKKDDVFEMNCSKCEKTFNSKRKYNAHVRKEHFMGYVCDKCGKTLQSYSGFITHRGNHNPIKQFVCPICGLGYHHKVNLKHHMAWHTGEKPFQCDICQKQFVHRVGLHKHKQTHDSETKRIECNVCQAKFRTNAHLNRHMMSHTGAKPYRCSTCGKCFSQMYNMKVHMQEHQNPGSTRHRRFKCDNCSRTFINKTNYEQHKLVINCDQAQ